MVGFRMARKKALKTRSKAAESSLEKPSDEKVLSSFSSTAEIKVSPKMVDQIIGQEKAVEIVKKASSQKRNVLLVGQPGTGKSMLAQAMAELIPVSELQDILITVNPLDENVPKVKVVKAGDGRKIVEAEKMKSRVAGGNVNFLLIIFMVFSSAMILFYMRGYFGDVISAALLICLYVMGGAMMFASQLSRGRLVEMDGIKMLVDNHGKKKAPFIEATGAKAGSLLGDCRHDPFQSSIDEVLLYVCRSGKLRKTSFGKLWKEMARKYPDLIERNADGYEAIVLPKKDALYTLGMKNGKAVASRIFIINRRPFAGKIVEVRTADKKIETKLPVFSDLRKKGYIIKTALKFGAEFRVYDKGYKPGQSHARWILYTAKEHESINWHDFAAKNRIAHSTNKTLLISIVDEESDVSYYEVSWQRP